MELNGLFAVRTEFLPLVDFLSLNRSVAQCSARSHTVF